MMYCGWRRGIEMYLMWTGKVSMRKELLNKDLKGMK